jgi:glycosyltransferase involved in cell wall biosynthesis
VTFVGYVDDEGLRQEFERCDIFVAPSRYESFGLIYLEAMRASKPCVAIRVGGVPEVVDHGITGVLVDADANMLGTAIAELVDDEERRKTMGRAGRRRFETHFSMAAFASDFSREIADWIGIDWQPVAQPKDSC